MPSRQTMRPLVAALALSLILPACTSDVATAPDAPSARVDRAGRVNVGGYRLQTAVTGAGRPSVVLMSGLDAPLATWGTIQPALAAEARVIAYDRAGVGGSDPSREPRRSAAEIVAELDRLLERADLRPPYVLVAHSVAGYYARLYAAERPHKVAGVVLLDAQHELQADGLRAALELQPDLLDLIAADQQYAGARAEVLATLTSVEQMRAAGPLPRVPLAVVTNMLPDAKAGETPEVRAFWYAMQAEWLAQGSVGLQLPTFGGHDVPRTDPETALHAIRWVLARAR